MGVLVTKIPVSTLLGSVCFSYVYILNIQAQETSQPKATKGQQQGKGGKQQKSGKKQDKQKPKQQKLPQQQEAGPQASGSKLGDKQVSSKDEKPSLPGGDSSEQPQKTKAELKAERRAVQVNSVKYKLFIELFPVNKLCKLIYPLCKLITLCLVRS